jgi:hypothetical protein
MKREGIEISAALISPAKMASQPVDWKDAQKPRPCQLSCGQLDCLALLPFGIEDFDLEVWETPF